MIEILFSKAALSYYALGLFTGYHQKIGKEIDQIQNRTNIYTLLFTVATFAGIAFLAYYSYKTKWWAFVGLIALNILTYVLIDVWVTQTTKNPTAIKGSIASLGRYLVPMLLVAMFYFTYSDFS
jgi:hypothetical protein